MTRSYHWPTWQRSSRTSCTRRWPSGVAVSLLVCAALASFPGAASAAAGGWKVETPANPSIVESTELLDVSCSSPSACTGVGFYRTDGGDETVSWAQRWGGKHWREQLLPQATETFTGAVSCPSASECVAVGGSGSAPSAELWNGKSWSIQSTADVSGISFGLFDGVSCASSSACVAVGYGTNSAGTATVPLAEAWNGTAWSDLSPDVPSGSTYTTLSQVSCASATDCMAVGFYAGSAFLPLAETWDGTSWTVQSVPLPTGGSGGIFADASCVTSSECYAVGDWNSSSSIDTQAPLAEVWDGTAWSVLTATEPKGLEATGLGSVSCSASSACTATGGVAGEGDGDSFVERWNGTSWKLQSTPLPPGETGGGVGTVSCPAANDCVALGDAEDSASDVQVGLAEVWDGKVWSSQPSPDAPAGENVLVATSCPSTSTCTAVGEYVDTAGQTVPLAERWNGKTWSVQLTDQSPYADLDGTSCASTSLCVAVGGFQSDGTNVPLVEEWSGGKWRFESTPKLKGNQGAVLTARVVPVAGIVHGGRRLRERRGVNVTLAERWNGRKWVLQRTEHRQAPPRPRCTALVPDGVIVYGGWRSRSLGNTRPLAERWTPSGWQARRRLLSRRGARLVQLLAVSCASTTRCTGRRRRVRRSDGPGACSSAGTARSGR